MEHTIVVIPVVRYIVEHRISDGEGADHYEKGCFNTREEALKARDLLAGEVMEEEPNVDVRENTTFYRNSGYEKLIPR